MTEKEVKKEIGEENWAEFCKWMIGQTVSLSPNGETDYYECDVRDFKRKLNTGYDRQKDSLMWD